MLLNKVPTLLLGLGGIGCSIADMTSQMLSDEEKMHIGIVGFDTNAEDLKKLSIKSVRTSAGEVVKKYLMDYPEYAKWFPVNKFTVNRGMDTGAGQIRAISRLAALAAVEQGKFVVLEEEIKRILAHNERKDTGSFNVFIVGSITGGTGAGLFLQMPFYIKNLLKQEFGIEGVRIRGMFISADITKNVQPSKINKDAVMVNAYACMKELNAFYLTQILEDGENHLELEYYEKTNQRQQTEKVKQKMTRAILEEDYGLEDIDYDSNLKDYRDIASDGSNIPYDAFYLIEGTDNTGGIGNVSLDAVKAQIAKMIFTILFTPIKAEDAGILDNTVLQDMEGGGMNRYSSAGMCVLRYPYEKMREYVTLRWIKDLVKDEWLLIDDAYEAELREAQSRQKTDPSVVVPDIQSAYSRIFKDQTKGKEGSRLGYLRSDAFFENPEDYDNPTSKASKRIDQINSKIDEIFADSAFEAASEECTINMEMMKNLDTAEQETARLYDALKDLERLVKSTVNEKRYQIANEIFPVSALSLKTQKDNPLCVNSLLADVHPVTARFLCYEMLTLLDKKIEDLEGAVDEKKLSAYKETDFYEEGHDKDSGVEDATQAIVLIKQNRIPIIKSGKKRLNILIGMVNSMLEEQKKILLLYGQNSLELATFRILRERFEILAEYYAKFFRNIGWNIKKNDVRIEQLENGFLHNPYGEQMVFATPEAFRYTYQEFQVKAEFKLPEQTRQAVFSEIFKITCGVLEDKNKELTEAQKRRRAETIDGKITSLFDKGVVETIHTLVLDKGREVIDLSLKQAMERELQMDKQIRPDDDGYEEMRIAYERARVEDAFAMAAPMFSVKSTSDVTETIYLALNPECAELSAGEPDKGMTKAHLVPEMNEATDNKPVSILMEKEFSRYEMICFKSKHKYVIDNLTKYAEDSKFARAYRQRIARLGKEPEEQGEDAYKTVVNPHLNRFWHEEGFVPPLGMEERERSNKETLKAFVYAMGMDCFIREREEEMDNRILWFYAPFGVTPVPVRKAGKLIGNSYADLFDSLKYNGRMKKNILMRAKMFMKQEKGYLDAEDLADTIQENWFIEDLVQSEPQKGDENYFDILASMYTKMDRGKWNRLFEGLQLMLFEYLSFMLDSNPRLINLAYQKIIDRLYQYSSGGLKERSELSNVEKKIREQVDRIRSEKYL